MKSRNSFIPLVFSFLSLAGLSPIDLAGIVRTQTFAVVCVLPLKPSRMNIFILKNIDNILLYGELTGVKLLSGPHIYLTTED